MPPADGDEGVETHPLVLGKPRGRQMRLRLALREIGGRSAAAAPGQTRYAPVWWGRQRGSQLQFEHASGVSPRLEGVLRAWAK
jgi:hypothetical protein